MTIDDIWEGDLLDRRSDAQLLMDFLVRRHAERSEAGQKGAYVVNVNAAWGHGKSFFMERLERQMALAGHLTAFVNAWRDDSSREPVVAVMAAIEESLKPYFAKEDATVKAWAAAKANGATILASLGKGALKQLLRKTVGEGIEELEELLISEEYVSLDVAKALEANCDRAGEAIVTEITTLLTKYVDQKITDYQTRILGASEFQARMRDVLCSLERHNRAKVPFFILIDELDRCRPTYAIEMLEQVKHLFDIDNTVFLVATDGDQLSHSIKAVYGSGFDGVRYLNRFFHRHYRFEERSLDDFVSYLFDLNKIDQSLIGTPNRARPVDIFIGAMITYNVTLRDAEQCFDILRSIVTTWEYEVPIQLTVILPLIIMFHRHDYVGMDNFMAENGGPVPSSSAWRIDVMENDDWGRVRKTTKVAVENFNQSLMVRAKSPLEDIYEYPRGSATSKFTADVLQSEFQLVHKSLVSGGTLSILNEYPKFVRRVGRLSSVATDSV